MTPRISQFESLDLPEGERLIWQGRPEARAVLRRVFHARLVAAYFLLLFAGRLAVGASEHQPWAETIAVALRLWVPLVIVLALLGGLALLYSRTTRYSITNRRVLLQFGAVIPMTLNIPLRQVVSAAKKEFPDGTGDIPLSVTSEQRLAFLLLWPHVRPWRLTKVEPMLRCVPDAATVAGLLSGALREVSPQAPEPVTSAMPLPQPAHLAPAIASAA